MSAVKILTDVRWWILSALIFAMIIGDTGEGPIIATVSLMIMMCLSLQGLRFNKEDLTENKKELLICIFICYVVAGGVTLFVGSFYHHDLWLGWVMIAAVPCAISVTSGTFLLKGDVKVAMIAVTAIYFIALAVTPLITQVFIGEAVDPWEVFKYVALFIIIPFVISIPLRKVKLDANLRTIFINILFFVLIFITFGANREFMFSEPTTVLWVVAGCLIRIVTVAIVVELVLRYIKVRRDGRIPMVLLSIWKNSALAMSMTMILIETQESVLPSAMSLPLEMVFFMILIWYYQKKCPPEDSVATTS